MGLPRAAVVGVVGALFAASVGCVREQTPSGRAPPETPPPKSPAPPPGGEPADPAHAGGAVTIATENNDGQDVTLTTADTLEVRLSSVPGTGYGWHISDPVPPVLRLIDEHLDLGGANAPGAAATNILRFTPVSAGEGVLRLAYTRPWEKNVTPKKTYSLHVLVR